MAFEKLRTIVITAIPKPRSRERFRKIAETTPTRVPAFFLNTAPKKPCLNRLDILAKSFDLPKPVSRVSTELGIECSGS